MIKDNSINDDEMSLVSLIFFMLEKKITIISFVLIFTIIGFAYLQSQKTIYLSKIKYEFNILPPTYEYNKDAYFNRKSKDKVAKEFEALFFSKTVFDEWIIHNKGTITYDEFNRVKKQDEIYLSKEDDELNVTFKAHRTRTTRVVELHTNNLKKLDSYYNYLNFVNDLIGKEYVIRSNQEISTMKAIYDKNVPHLLKFYTFINSISNGEKVFTIYRPSSPEKIHPRASTIIIISSLIGFIFSLLFLFLQKEINQYKSLNKLL